MRPDEQQTMRAAARRVCCTGWTILGGDSPLLVSAGAPGSRSQAAREISLSHAGCQKPKVSKVLVDGEQACGPQHEVKPAASTKKPTESRVAHFPTKAMPSVLRPDGALGFGGVWGVARMQRIVRNRRGPSELSTSRQKGSYKPKVKARSAQRESEGVIVP